MYNCSEPSGIKCGDLYMSYKSIFQDVRNAMDWVHIKVRQASLNVLCSLGVRGYRSVIKCCCLHLYAWWLNRRFTVCALCMSVHKIDFYSILTTMFWTGTFDFEEDVAHLFLLVRITYGMLTWVCFLCRAIWSAWQWRKWRCMFIRMTSCPWFLTACVNTTPRSSCSLTATMTTQTWGNTWPAALMLIACTLWLHRVTLWWHQLDGCSFNLRVYSTKSLGAFLLNQWYIVCLDEHSNIIMWMWKKLLTIQSGPFSLCALWVDHSCSSHMTPCAVAVLCVCVLQKVMAYLLEVPGHKVSS